MENVLEVKNLNVNYPNFSLRDINFSVPEGAVAGFIGLNGQGKTTTIRSLLGLTKNDATVKILGMDFKKCERQVKEKLGVVFDESYLYERLSCKAMRDLCAHIYPDWDEIIFQKFLKRFKLDETQKIITLSKGMKMKLALALALSHHAKFLIMDEPTSGLDPLIRREVLDILAQYMEEEGLGVIYSTHITSDLEKFADILILIHDGKIVFEKEKDEFLESHLIIKGDIDKLDDSVRKKFLSYRQNRFGYEAIAKNTHEIKNQIKNAVFEKPTIEDLMLVYTKEKRDV